MSSLRYPAEPGDQMRFPAAPLHTGSGGGVNASTVLAKDALKAASSSAAGVPAPPLARTSRDDPAGQEVAAAAGDGKATAAAPPPTVIGIDLSLVSTGIAGRDWVETIGGGSIPKAEVTLQRQWTRIRKVRAHLTDFLDSADLVVLEAPSFGSNDPSAHERAALWWLVVGRCLSRDVPLAVVAPATLKVYATGSGRASKEDVVQAVATRLPQLQFRGNDQADAIVLMAMGCDHLGQPLVDLPKTHRRALDSVTWPDAGAHR